MAALIIFINQVCCLVFTVFCFHTLSLLCMLLSVTYTPCTNADCALCLLLHKSYFYCFVQEMEGIYWRMS